jgi:hypothetical protein
MKKITKFAISISFALTVLTALSACQVSAEAGGHKLMDANLGGSSNTTSYSYDFTENGCETGTKVFSSIDDMCRTLRNDSANNYCASDLRFEFFRSQCPGQSW